MGILVKTLAKAAVVAAGTYMVFVCGYAFGAYSTTKKIDDGTISIDDLHEGTDALDIGTLAFAEVARR